MEDISGAVRNILIGSSYLQKPAESDKTDRQADIAAAISIRKGAGITVIIQNDIRQRYAIMDQSIVWYGSIDFLALGRKDAFRFENAEIAGEPLDIRIELPDQ